MANTDRTSKVLATVVAIFVGLIAAAAFLGLSFLPTLSFLGPQSSFNVANAFFNLTGISPTTWQALSYGFYYFGALAVIGIAAYLYFRFYADKPAENLKAEKNNNENAESTQKSSAITKALLLVGGLFALNFARGIIAGLIGTARPIDFAGGAASGGLSQNFLYSILNWLNAPSNAVHSLTTNFPSGHVTLCFFAFYATVFLFYKAWQDYQKANDKTGKGRRLFLIGLLMGVTGLLAAFTMFARWAGMAHSFAAVFVAAFVFAPAGIFLVRGVIEGGSAYLRSKVTLGNIAYRRLKYAVGINTILLIIAALSIIIAYVVGINWLKMLGFGLLLTNLVLYIPCIVFWLKHRSSGTRIKILKGAELGFLGFALVASFGLVIASIVSIAGPGLKLPGMLGFGSLLTGLVLCIPCMAFWIKKLQTWGIQKLPKQKKKLLAMLILTLWVILGGAVALFSNQIISNKLFLYGSVLVSATLASFSVLCLSGMPSADSEKIQRRLLFIAAGVAAAATIGLAITLAVSNAANVAFSGGFITALQSGLLVSAIFGSDSKVLNSN